MLLPDSLRLKRKERSPRVRRGESLFSRSEFTNRRIINSLSGHASNGLVYAVNPPSRILALGVSDFVDAIQIL